MIKEKLFNHSRLNTIVCCPNWANLVNANEKWWSNVKWQRFTSKVYWNLVYPNITDFKKRNNRRISLKRFSWDKSLKYYILQSFFLVKISLSKKVLLFRFFVFVKNTVKTANLYKEYNLYLHAEKIIDGIISIA